jgi:hypothetical protein
MGGFPYPKDGPVNYVRRIAVALGSLLALVLAGGANWRIP